MSVTPTLNLFVNPDHVPSPDYWMDVVVPGSSNYQGLSHGSVPMTTSPPNQFHIDIDVNSPHTGSDTTVRVELGMLSTDPNNDEIHVDLKNPSQTSVGGGFVKVIDAQETTRPIESGDITT